MVNDLSGSVYKFCECIHEIIVSSFPGGLNSQTNNRFQVHCQKYGITEKKTSVHKT